VSNISIRRMAADEVSKIMDWARKEGWNPGIHDTEIFAQTDPAGLFCAETGGEMIGGISAVAYDDHYGFVGLFIVRPDLRGHRVGLDLAQRALDHLGDRIIGIDGVLAKERQYAKFFGFVPGGRNVRYEGRPVGRVTPDLIDARDVPFSDLSAYDRRHFPAPRDRFLKMWIHQPGATALADTRGGTLRGYGVIRPCVVGAKLGPLFADSPAVAEDLLLALCAKVPTGPVYLDTPGDNPLAVELALKFGMHEVFATTRMYRGGTPEFSKNEVFGITTFELG
jgi:GNAT superfamily N-acetyltransferase